MQELRELRQLREENGRLKQLVADLSLDRQILHEIVSKKAIKPRQRCRLARWTQEAYRIGARRSARLLQVPWATLLYKSRKKSQEPLIRRLREMAATHVRYGYRRLTVLLRREGLPKDEIPQRLRGMSPEEKDVLWGRVRKMRG